MLQSDKLVQPKTATRYFDSFLNLITGPFFGPLVFLFGGAGGGGYIALDNGGAFLSGAIYGSVIGLVAWFAIRIFSWFS